MNNQAQTFLMSRTSEYQVRLDRQGHFPRETFELSWTPTSPRTSQLIHVLGHCLQRKRGLNLQHAISKGCKKFTSNRSWPGTVVRSGIVVVTEGEFVKKPMLFRPKFKERECLSEFRVAKKDLPLLADALWLPDTFHCYQRTIAAKLEGLCICLGECCLLADIATSLQDLANLFLNLAWYQIQSWITFTIYMVTNCVSAIMIYWIHVTRMPYEEKGLHYKLFWLYRQNVKTNMHTLAGAKNNVEWPQKGWLPEVSVGDWTKWFDSQPVWPSWLVKEMHYIIFGL